MAGMLPDQPPAFRDWFLPFCRRPPAYGIGPAHKLGRDPKNQLRHLKGPEMRQQSVTIFAGTNIQPHLQYQPIATMSVRQLEGYSYPIDRFIRAALDLGENEHGTHSIHLPQLTEYFVHGVWFQRQGFVSDVLAESQIEQAKIRMELFWNILATQKLPERKGLAYYEYTVEDIIIITSIAVYLGILGNNTLDGSHPPTVKGKAFRDLILNAILMPEILTFKDSLFVRIIQHPSTAVLLLKVAEVTRSSTLFEEAGRHVVGVLEAVHAYPQVKNWFYALLERKTTAEVGRAYAQVKQYLKNVLWYRLRTMDFLDRLRHEEEVFNFKPVPEEFFLHARAQIVRALAESRNMGLLTGRREGGWLPKNWWRNVPSHFHASIQDVPLGKTLDDPKAYIESRTVAPFDFFDPPVYRSRLLLRALYGDVNLYRKVTQIYPSVTKGKYTKTDVLKDVVSKVPLVNRLQGQLILKTAARSQAAYEAYSTFDSQKVIKKENEALKKMIKKTKAKDKQGEDTRQVMSPISFIANAIAFYVEPLVGTGLWKNKTAGPLIGESGSIAGRNFIRPAYKFGEDTSEFKESTFDVIGIDHGGITRGVNYLLCGKVEALPGYSDYWPIHEHYAKYSKSTSDLRRGEPGTAVPNHWNLASPKGNPRMPGPYRVRFNNLESGLIPGSLLEKMPQDSRDAKLASSHPVPERPGLMTRESPALRDTDSKTAVKPTHNFEDAEEFLVKSMGPGVAAPENKRSKPLKGILKNPIPKIVVTDPDGEPVKTSEISTGTRSLAKDGAANFYRYISQPGQREEDLEDLEPLKRVPSQAIKHLDEFGGNK